MRTGAVENGSVRLDLAFDFSKHRAEIRRSPKRARQAKGTFRPRRSGTILRPPRDRETRSDRRFRAARALRLRSAASVPRRHVRYSVQVDPDGRTARGRLRGCGDTEIRDRFSAFGQRLFDLLTIVGRLDMREFGMARGARDIPFYEGANLFPFERFGTRNSWCFRLLFPAHCRAACCERAT